MNNKKILYVVESFGAGVYSFLVELCNSLCEEYEITIVYSIRNETPKNFKEDFNKNIKFIYIDMYRGLSLKKDISALRSLIKIIKVHNPDIVHLHSSKAGFLGRLACKLIGYNMKKVFYNPHGFSFLQLNETKHKRKIYFILEKIAAVFGGNIIGVSKSEYLEALKLSKNSYEIDNGINIKKIDDILKNIKLYRRNNIAVGTIGRISYQKNPKLFNKIASHFPKIKFIWIGDGELKNELKEKNIQVTGWMKHEEVIKFLDENVDIYIQTSLWEGMPIALLEAMYLGKACIVTNVIGNKDVITHKSDGYIAQDYNDYINYIDYLYRDSEEMKILGNRACLKVKKTYNTEVMIKNYKNRYYFKEV